MSDQENIEEPYNHKEEDDRFMNMGAGIHIDPEHTYPKLGEEDKDATSFDKDKVDRDINRPYDFLLGTDRKKEFSEEPSYADQHAKYPETVRPVGPMFRVFDLSDETQVQTLNTLSTGYNNTAAPRSMVEIVDKQWDDKTRNWKLLTRVTTFLYLKILEKD